MGSTEDLGESVMRKLLGRSGPRRMDSEAIPGWVLKYGVDRISIHTSVDFFPEWLSNRRPPWSDYHSFMSG